ncbi:hypothetical protein AGMMS50229_14400 [Campylobacterota bacterium]|nr:hypothetical protein AGMMS50229_14400 [Campylobacterota bacterium]
MESLLSDATVTALAKQKASSLFGGSRKIALIAIDGNWGPPISGRFDSDFLNIWAAVPAGNKGEVILQGGRNGQWNISIPFQPLGKPEKISLYKLHLSVQGEFPDEFVIRLNCGAETFYDNNDGQNYRLTPYQRYFSSAAFNEQYILDFNSILPVVLYNKSSPALES